MPYAQNTDVSAERSRAEIETVLKAAKASRFGYMTDEDSAAIVFELLGLRMKMTVPMPKLEDAQFGRTPKGRVRSKENARRQAYEQELRRRWRALLLVIKAKLEAVASGISTIEEEFLSSITNARGITIGEWFRVTGEKALGITRQLPAPTGDAGRNYTSVEIVQ